MEIIYSKYIHIFEEIARVCMKEEEFITQLFFFSVAQRRVLIQYQQHQTKSLFCRFYEVKPEFGKAFSEFQTGTT